MKIYVGNLSYSSTEEELQEMFGRYGSVASAKIIVDHYSGNSKGFAFVEMDNQSEGEAAIKALNDQEINGRNINVSVARPPRSKGGNFSKGGFKKRF